MSVAYYDANAAAYFRDTVTADVSQLRARFAAHLPRGGTVLDAGCGSGRDAAAFRDAGFNVTAFDGSAEMVRLARQHTGLEIQHMTFADMRWDGAFDGIWASASLLHVPRRALPATFARVARALRPYGVWYLSMKHGMDERTVDGRRFTDVTLEEIARLVQAQGLVLLDGWLTTDVRPNRDDRWFNALTRNDSARL